jgi:tetratricopeptide (TPR) repeat protein
LLALAILLCSSGARAQGRSRPIAILFDAQPPRPAAAATAVTASDGMDEAMRSSAALRALRKAFLDEGIVEPLPFSIEMPTIARALLDARVNLAPGANPTEAERIRIAAACGAAYVVNVAFTLSAPPNAAVSADDAPPEKIPTLEVEAIEVKQGRTPAAGKRWRDLMRISDNLSAVQISRREGLSDALNSAARTLVLRFLGTPALREQRRRTPSSELLPRPVTPPTTTENEQMLPAGQRAKQALSRAETILKEGNVEEGIRELRRGINLAPRAIAPRLALARVWESLQRPDRVEEETRRALAVAARDEPAALRSELLWLLGTTQRNVGDLDGAKATFEEALTLDPSSRTVRRTLGQILLARGDSEGAEAHFTALVAATPEDRESVFGLARVLCLRGDYEGALRQVSTAGISEAERSAFADGTFLEAAMRIGARLAQNRASFDQGSLDRATFLTVVRSHILRTTPLKKLLVGSPPPASTSDATRATHKHYVLAASLLLQALTAMQSFLENNDNPAGAQARLYLGEFFREMNEAATTNG